MKKFIAMLLSISIMLSNFSPVVYAAESENNTGDVAVVSTDVLAQGDAGSSAKWSLSADGIMTISGAGTMTGYNSDNDKYARGAIIMIR